MGAALELASSRQFCCADDVHLIQRIVREERPDITVIIGAGSGTMSLAFLEVRRDAPQIGAARLWSIDNSREALHWERQAWLNAGFLKSPVGVTQIHSDSRHAGLRFQQRVDFLIVDGDHREGPLRRDLAAWLPAASTHGIVMLHDYDAIDAPVRSPDVKLVADQTFGGDWETYAREGWSKVWRKVL